MTKQVGRIVVLVAALCAAFFVIRGCGGTGSDQYYSFTLQTSLDKAISDLSMPGIAFCLTEASGRTWAQASGEADMSTHAALTPDALFRIASNSKTYTATAVLLLVDDKLVGLDDPVSMYIHDLGIPHDDVITVRMLLNHTSGLADHENDSSWMDTQIAADPFREYTPQELIDVAISIAPDLLFTPGTDYHYSNSGYVALSVIVSRMSGMEFKDFVRTRIIEHLGLMHTYILPGNYMPATPYAHGYVFSAGAATQDLTDINESWDVGSGGVIATVCDMAAFVRALFGGELLSADSLTQMETFSAVKPYGLGCEHTDAFGWGHNGSTYGYNSQMGYDPATGVAVAVAINGTSNDTAVLRNIFARFSEITTSFKRELGY